MRVPYPMPNAVRQGSPTVGQVALEAQGCQRRTQLHTVCPVFRTELPSRGQVDDQTLVFGEAEDMSGLFEVNGTDVREAG